MVSVLSLKISDVRTEQGARQSLSKPERRGYIRAVLCLQKKPSLYRDFIGAKGRFDVFQAEHINEAFNIHLNV